MKKTITTFILAIAMVVSGFILFPSTAKAQECAWTLYVNGNKYTTSSSYYQSGQLKVSGSAVYLNNFTGKTIEAIPGGSYGDDDAPQLTIYVTGNCTLTGGKLDDGSYGMIYAEPRSGGSGAGSMVTITSKTSNSTLNLNYQDYPSTRAQKADYNLIRADKVSLSGYTDYNLNAKIYGQTSGYTLYGVNADMTYFTFASQVDMSLTAGTYSYAAGGSTVEAKSAGAIMGVKGTLIHNSKDYASIDTNTGNTSTSAVHCADTVYANGPGLYLKNISGVKPYSTWITASGKVEYTASDDNMYYTAFVSTYANDSLKAISVSDIMSEAELGKKGSAQYSDSRYVAQTAKGYYRKVDTGRLDIETGQVWTDDSNLHADTSLKYAYWQGIDTVPMPGYQLVSDDMTTEKMQAAAKNALGYTPDDTNFSSKLGRTSLKYSYVTPVITKQPASAYDIGNLSDLSITASTPTAACSWDQFTWNAEKSYQWFLRVYSDASTCQDFEMSTFGGDMDGFEALDTASPSLGFDTSYKSFTVNVKGKTLALGDAAKLEIYCKVSTIGDSVDTDKAQLFLDHTSQILPAKAATCTESGLTEGKKCSVCGQVVTKQMVIKPLGHDPVKCTDKAATCTEAGSKGGIVCSRCDLVIEAPTVVPATGHHEVAKADTPATLTENGQSGATYCDVCGTVIKAGDVIYSPAEITLDTTQYTYDGTEKDPTVSVVDTAGKTIPSSNYTVTKSSGRTEVGSYIYSIEFKGNYSGTKTVSFVIKPAKPTVKSLTCANKKLTVTIAAQPSKTGGSKYQIAYKQKGTSTWKFTTTASYKKAISGLKKGKKYYIRVRSFKKIDGTTYCGAWSKAKLSPQIK